MPANAQLRKKIRWINIRWPNRWIRQFKRNKANAKKAADNMPLIHVTNASNFEKIISTSPVQIKVSNEENSKDITLRTEKGVDLGNSVYCYAGRARSEFGNIVLAFDATCENGHTGEATPFDTGDMLSGKTLCKLQTHQTLEGFIEASSVPLRGWRKAFALFMAGYFSTPLDYLVGRPNMLDPEEIFQNSDNEWPAWTFEVRFHEDHDLSGLVAAAYDSFVDSLLFIIAEKEPSYGPSKTAKVVRSRYIHGFRIDAGFYDNCDKMNQWVRGEMSAILKK